MESSDQSSPSIPIKKAFEYRKACELGDGKACLYFGNYLQCARTDTICKNNKRVRKFLQRACSLGEADGCLYLAGMQITGQVPGSEKEAFQNAMTACNMGSTDACFLAATFTRAGLGTKKDCSCGL
ncbi:hypothetical protein GUITHDRAFT_152585, partial [Guillardia theta CCMP2712]